jgi:dolichyl-phosphate beta-glucosyltransferase
MEKIKLSVIVPVFNEELIIAEALKKITDFLIKKSYSWEIIVIDDGSFDKTTMIVDSFGLKNLRLEKLSVNRGKGGAIRRGVELANGEFIIFTDVDLSVPIEYVDKFLLELEKGNPIVIGSRRIIGSKIIKHQGWLRESMGRGFTFLSRIVTGTNTSDFTCGLKGFRADVAKKIFAKSVLNRWVFDSEVIFLAQKFKFRIVEIPVEWINREDSRIESLGSTGFKSFMELMQIRLNDFAGKYD